MQENNGVNTFWLILITLGGIFGVINFIRAFNKDEPTSAEAYEKIITDKDEIIKALEKKVEQYKKLIDDGKSG